MANTRNIIAKPHCIAAVAAALLVTGAQAAQPSHALQEMFTARTSGPAQPKVLPTVHSPRPYREAIEKPCNESECFLKFAKIADFRLLEISNVSCITIQDPADDSKFFVLSKSANLTKPRSIVAVLPATGIAGTAVTTSQSGPFYIDAGESPFLSATSPATGYGMICTISGTLWRTD